MNAHATDEATASHVTGRRFVIRNGGAEAEIASLAAALRGYRRQGVELAEPFGPDELPPMGSGILLAPWGNRIEDGRWTLDGAVQQLDITEPSRGHASHGLLRNTGYHALAQEPGQLLLGAEIFPQHGFPFRMTHTVRYRLDDDGHLHVEQDLVNHSRAVAPAALGAHPYLRIGDVPTERLRLTVPATRYLQADERLIPRAVAPLDGEHDFTRGRALDGILLDCAFTGLEADADGLVRHRLEAPDGRAAALWTDDAFPYVHIFVTNQYRGRPLAVAIEPMTAPANAFNSGDGLRWLAPGGRLTARWGIESWL
ncbi:aldose 1-epimerase family protein [Zafaria sp. Z1313]|uniref:aldose 1-epimerase family protein n=1 Tax=unclassified Zafaria TaxID=2828765 RepID=UPI002E7715C1|nr:aldose 1-epimerase family protein [Zafaria sp. J156]MEE1619920.1 aldose 1-epimerase family protein [Zafaria sp. J156]